MYCFNTVETKIYFPRVYHIYSVYLDRQARSNFDLACLSKYTGTNRHSSLSAYRIIELGHSISYKIACVQTNQYSLFDCFGSLVTHRVPSKDSDQTA